MVPNLDVGEARTEAERAGFTSFVLPTAGVVDRPSFFDAVRVTLPLEPPLVGSHSWDALSDSLWEGLRTHEARSFLIIWPNTAAMASAAGPDLQIALDVFVDVADSLGDPEPTCGEPKVVAVLVG